MYPRATSNPLSLLRFFVVCAVLMLGVVKVGYGQRVYATIVASEGSGVNYANNAVSPPPGNIEPSATPRARISVSGSDNSGSIRLQFESVVPTNTAIWVRISDKFTETNANVTASAMIGSSVASGSTADHIVMNDGSAYYRVSSTSVFDGVQIIATGGSTGLLFPTPTTASVNVHYAFKEPSSSDCTTKLGFNVNSTLGSKISNPDRAIDGNLNTHAIFVPVVLLGGVMTQNVYFSRLSNPADVATVTLSIPPGILDLSLFDGIAIRTYNGNELVSDVQLSSLLSLDLLGLLGSKEKYTVSLPPGDRFDRISFEYNAGLLLSSNLNLYEMDITPAAPTVPIAFPGIVEVCDGESAVLSAESVSDESVLRWYDEHGQLLQESVANSDTYVTSPLSYSPSSETTFIYVTSAWNVGCPSESERTVIAIAVKPKPTITLITGAASICEKGTTTLSSETKNGVWNSLDETVATVDSFGLVTGVNVGSTTIQYTVTDPITMCSSTVEMEITVLPQPGKPHLTITNVQN